MLVLSFIALAIICTLLYFVLQGRHFSGFFKRYETARDVGMVGAELGRGLLSTGASRNPIYADWK
jgi:hypothetical protein